MKSKIYCYRAKDGVRWRIKRKGRIVAESGEAYVRMSSAQRSLRALIESFALGEYEFIDQTATRKSE